MWLSPLPYVVGALFHVVLALLYVNQLDARRQALLQPMFPVAGFLLVALVPVLAMRAVAEEARSGSLDLLVAARVRASALVVGKWLACWVTALAVLLPAVLFVLLVAWWGSPDPGPGVAGYVGLALLAGALAGVGLVASAATSSQPVAAMGAFFLALLLWFSHVGSETLTAGSLLAHFSLSERLRAAAGGVLDTSDVGFFVLFTCAALTLATTFVSRRSAA